MMSSFTIIDGSLSAITTFYMYDFEVNEQEATASPLGASPMVGVMSFLGSSQRRPRSITGSRALRRTQSTSAIQFQPYRSRGIPFQLPESPSPLPHTHSRTNPLDSAVPLDTIDVDTIDVDIEMPHHPISPSPWSPTPTHWEHSPSTSLPISHQRCLQVLQVMKSEGLSFGEFVAVVTDRQNKSFERIQNQFYRSDSQLFLEVVNNLFQYGKERFSSWMEEHALSLVCRKITNEFVSVSGDMYLPKDPQTNRINRRFLSSWSVKDVFGIGLGNSLRDRMPWWTSVLGAATSDKRKSEGRDPSLGMNVVTAQVLHIRSLACAKLQSMMGLFAWATGASKHLIEVLSHCSLSVSHPATLRYIGDIASQALAAARQVVPGSILLSYDNLNLSTSTSIEQRPDAPSKVQSGTFPIIYPLFFRSPFVWRSGTYVPISDVMCLAPILDAARNTDGLQLADLDPSRDQVQSFLTQLSITVTRTLLRYHPGFSENGINYDADPALHYILRRPLPTGHCTTFHPLRVSTTEEASTAGNLRLHEEIFFDQLQMKAEELALFALPSINDRLTNSRIRSCQLERRGDDSAWDDRTVFQLGIGLFHLQMNLAWCILNKHRFHADQSGSLAFYFDLLEKKRLGAAKPEYYTLLAALEEIRDGLLISAWREKITATKGMDLTQFSNTQPSVNALLTLSVEIISEFASPMNVALSKEDPDPEQDPVHQNSRLLLRDLLYFTELSIAISEGDFGRIEDILPDIAALFNGAGSHKYCAEILHLLHNFKKVWSKEFSDIMRDNHLVNVSTLPGHCMPVDLNMEHLIGYLKRLFAAKGIYSTWDQLGNVSAAIVDLQNIKKHFGMMMDTSYKNRTHAAADTATLVFRVANKVQDLKIQHFIRGRKTFSVKAAPDLLQSGWTKLSNSTLGRFNKRLKAYHERYGVAFEDEVDEMPDMAFGESNSDE